jgi:LEA14-like dessication related protein
MKYLVKAMLLVAVAMGLTQPAFAKPLMGFLAKPTVTYDRVEVKRITFEKAHVEFVFLVDNPNPLGLDHLLLDYELFLKGKSAASGRGMKFAVKPKGRSELRLPGEIDYIRLFTSGELLTRAITRGERHIPFTLQGTFRSDVKMLKYAQPIKAEGVLPLPEHGGRPAPGPAQRPVPGPRPPR